MEPQIIALPGLGVVELSPMSEEEYQASIRAELERIMGSAEEQEE